ncbi:MAG: trypsin-like peptidase domain-containing protein [Gammaproteobacteria bacterium]|nr:trypsin-like peptidase domain-containing protein [Gammaproteobacteria bacterium]
MTRTLKFILRFIIIGLASAFILIYFFPELTQNLPGTKKSVVEFKEHTNHPAPVLRNNAPLSYADAVESAAPSVVNIYTRKIITEQAHPLLKEPLFRYFFGDNAGQPRQRQESSLGSGVIVSPQGYILTNNHVIAAADEIQVALEDGQTTQATLVGSDPETDLAVLKIKLENIPSITLGDDITLRVGDVVLAIGNPFGVGKTVTSGIVSATGRNQLGINTFENFIQTDAAINPGNSGGALITAEGYLVGINTAIFSKSGGSQGIGFAIPMSLAKDVMTQIIEYGEVKRGWLGVGIQEITDELAQSFRLRSKDGVILSGVMRDGPADKADLAVGDVITHINNQAITNVHNALNLISQNKPGQSVKINGIRNGQKFETEAIVGQRPREEK